MKLEQAQDTMILQYVSTRLIMLSPVAFIACYLRHFGSQLPAIRGTVWIYK